MKLQSAIQSKTAAIALIIVALLLGTITTVVPGDHIDDYESFSGTLDDSENEVDEYVIWLPASTSVDVECTWTPVYPDLDMTVYYAGSWVAWGSSSENGIESFSFSTDSSGDYTFEIDVYDWDSYSTVDYSLLVSWGSATSSSSSGSSSSGSSSSTYPSTTGGTTTGTGTETGTGTSTTGDNGDDEIIPIESDSEIRYADGHEKDEKYEWDVEKFTEDRDPVETKDIDPEDDIHFAEGSEIKLTLLKDLSGKDWDEEDLGDLWDDNDDWMELLIDDEEAEDETYEWAVFFILPVDLETDGEDGSFIKSLFDAIGADVDEKDGFIEINMEFVDEEHDIKYDAETGVLEEWEADWEDDGDDFSFKLVRNHGFLGGFGGDLLPASTSWFILPLIILPIIIISRRRTE